MPVTQGMRVHTRDRTEVATSGTTSWTSTPASWPGRAAAALAAEPGTVVGAPTDHPETSAVLSAAETILEFKTQAARDIEGARIKSIIDPRLSDHVRREAGGAQVRRRIQAGGLTRGPCGGARRTPLSSCKA